MTFQRKWRTLRRQSLLTLLLLLPAWLLSGAARLLVLSLPFRRFAPYLGAHHGLGSLIPVLELGQVSRARSIGSAVRIAGKYAPWNANCQAQAIAARVLLGVFRVPYALFYGLARDPNAALKAHAWVCAGPVRVTGGYSFDQFTVVAVFAALPKIPQAGS